MEQTANRMADYLLIDDAREGLDNEVGLTKRPGFVKYPPSRWVEHTPPNLAVPFTKLPDIEGLLLWCKDSEWVRTSNPVVAIESIILRHRAGVFPTTMITVHRRGRSLRLRAVRWFEIAGHVVSQFVRGAQR